MSIQEILNESKTIAVVGMSRDPTKDSHFVSKYMKENGYNIIPINPNSSKILGKDCYPSLLDMPENLQKKIDIINIFRPSNDVMKIVMDALKIKKKTGAIKTIWMQVGIVNREAENQAVKSGLKVVMDSCIMVEHKRLKKIR